MEKTVPTKIDWARLAAYIDGEGSIGLTSRKYKRPDGSEYCYDILRILMCNTDPRLIAWCRDVFHASPRTVTWFRKRGLGRRIYECAWVSRKAANILEHCLPYFLLKREQAEVALQYGKTFKRRGRVRINERDLASRRVLASELKRLKHCELELPLPKLTQ